MGLTIVFNYVPAFFACDEEGPFDDSDQPWIMSQHHSRSAAGSIKNTIAGILYSWMDSLSLNRAITNVSLSFLWVLVISVAVGFGIEHGQPMEAATINLWSNVAASFMVIHLALSLSIDQLIFAVLGTIKRYLWG